MPDTVVMITRLVLAAVLGALIGAEREYRAKVAGTRTHMLVAVGAALMVIVSRWGFGGEGDPSRVAAQIVSGIGFIGAGAIMVNKHAVHGLTTAAGIWVAAGIGMAVACGLYGLAVSAAAISLIGLEVFGWFFRNRRRILAESADEDETKALRPVSTEALAPNVQREAESAPGACWIVLASGSPRRAKILEDAGVNFTVMKTDAAEVSIPDDPEATVRANAAAKLAAAREELARHPLAAPCGGVLAADTIVWFDGRIYGKPRDLEEAAKFLRELSGRTHTVFTGLAFAGADGAVRTAVSRSDVTFRELDEAAIAEYIARVKPLDRAGAYDIDESGDLIVASYTGSYENIMGLPLEPLAGFGVLA
jgi:putative Mg2+ transporter-C (MgtC) family protein